MVSSLRSSIANFEELFAASALKSVRAAARRINLAHAAGQGILENRAVTAPADLKFLRANPSFAESVRRHYNTVKEVATNKKTVLRASDVIPVNISNLKTR